MRVDVHARRWGSPTGGPDGMAMAAAFLAETLERLGHQVRRVSDQPDLSADLTITVVQPTWRRLAARAGELGACGRLVYWHHHGEIPPAYGCLTAAPPAIAGADVVLPPSSWAAESGGNAVGTEILVPGAGVAKGGHIAVEVARMNPTLRWYVLRGRCSSADLGPWAAIADVAPGVVEPATFLGRARAVLSPTRFEVHPLVLVEAAVRGIPIVCTDLPSTRAAAGASAIYVPMNAPPKVWDDALWDLLAGRAVLPRLELPPYAHVVREALRGLREGRAAA